MILLWNPSHKHLLPLQISPPYKKSPYNFSIDYTVYTVYTVHMPQKTFYLRKADIPLWEAITDKAEFIHNALNVPSTPFKVVPGAIAPTGNVQAVVKEATGIGGVAPHVTRTKRYPDTPSIPVIPSSDHRKTDKVPEPDATLCKHGAYPSYCKKARPGKPCKEK